MNPNVVLGVVGSVLVLGVVFEMLRRQKLREKYAVIWFLIAIAVIVLALVPGVLSGAARLLGVQVPSNLLFFGASMALLLLSLQFSFELGRLEEKARTLAEDLAVLRLEVEAVRGAHPDLVGDNPAPNKPDAQDDRVGLDDRSQQPRQSHRDVDPGASPVDG